MKKILSLILLAICFDAVGQNPSIIPQPVQVNLRNGIFPLDKLTFKCDNEFAAQAEFIKKELGSKKIVCTTLTTKSTPTFSILTDRKISPEGYRLQITPTQIRIYASRAAGAHYGVMSLLQLIDTQQGALQCMTIEDEPRYAWRGFMLDEARHFFGKQKVLQILDLMSYFKLNKFHWHLSDSEGWRIEIKAYPKLTTIGGAGYWSNLNSDEVNFYTQDDIKEVVAYAAARNIEIIPEIDMPGHATAANRAYPEYSGGKTPEFPDFTFNPGKEQTYTFLTNILREVGELFPSSYLHIGGDEVAFGIEAWNSDPDVQALMKKNGYTLLRQAEHYFFDRMSDSVRAIGKQLVGWDELIEAQSELSTTIMWWRHNKPEVLKESLERGYKTILCPRVPNYLDFIQHSDHKWGRIWSGEFGPLERVYSFPDDKIGGMNIDPAAMKNIVGLQANLWTERVHYKQRLDYMIWPRLCAVAESAWSPASKKDFKSFEQRLEPIYKKLEKMDIYYFYHQEPSRHPEAMGRERDNAIRETPVIIND